MHTHNNKSLKIVSSKEYVCNLVALGYTRFDQVRGGGILINGRPYDQLMPYIRDTFRSRGIKINRGWLRDVVTVLAHGGLDLQGNYTDIEYQY